MVYDCFIFNDELDLLELRLTFLADAADRFVLVEAERTLSGEQKPLHYELNKERFARFHHKIIHIIVPVNEMKPWDYEFYQRNAIKNGLAQCEAADIIFISDIDEIVHIKEIISIKDLQLPALIEIPMYYYFFDLRTNADFFVNLVANWSFIQQADLGNRYHGYPLLVKNRITKGSVNTGWHFSYLFGYDIAKYQEKIRSFSHQEYNAPYFLDPERIRKCVALKIDLFERYFMRLNVDKKRLEPILPFIRQTGFRELFYHPAFEKVFSPGNILFTLHKKYYRRIRHRLQHLFDKKDNP